MKTGRMTPSEISYTSHERRSVHMGTLGEATLQDMIDLVRLAREERCAELDEAVEYGRWGDAAKAEAQVLELTEIIGMLGARATRTRGGK
jgi:hypothetical protein